MKRSFLIVLFLFFIYSFSHAQSIWKKKRYEVLVGAGPTLFFGDVGGFSHGKNLLGFKDITIKQIRYNANVNFKYRITQDISVRLSLAGGALHATDVRGSNENREFESSMNFFETSLIGEYYFIKNKAEDSYLFTKGRGEGFGGFLRSLDFYFLTGVGALNYSVTGNQQLENLNIDHGGVTAVIPIGIGSSLVYTPNINFGIELAARYAFSDNLDGYTSQYSSSNDVYYFFNFTFTYKLKTGPKGLPSFR
jgi:hypothetical protein